MRSLLGRFHRPFARGVDEQLLLLNNLGDGSTLSLDFTTGVLDPRLTFTRSTNATFINSQGYVQFANANLMTYSNPRQTGAAWLTSGTVTWGSSTLTDPTGGSAAQSITFGTTTGAIFNTTGTTVASGITHTFSVWMRSATGTTNVRIGDANVGAVATVTLTTTWQRFNCQYTTSGTNDGGAIYSQTGTPSAEFYVWGAQVQPGSIVGELIQTSGTINTNTPRFDYDPSTRQPRGLLIEGSASNYGTYSESFATSGSGTLWTYSELDKNATLAQGPSGANDAAQFNERTTTTIHRISQFVTAAAGAVTISVWAKAIDPTTPRRLFLNAIGFMGCGALFDLDPNVQTGESGTAVNVAGTAANRAGTWVKYPNGWYRCSVVGTYNTAQTLYLQVNRASSTVATDDTYSGSTANGLMLYGFQTELGSGASSYIPTGASTGNRGQDAMTMADISSLNFNQSGGTVMMQIDGGPRDLNTFPYFAQFEKSPSGRGWGFLRMNVSSSVGPRIFGTAFDNAGSVIITSSNHLRPSGKIKFATTLEPSVARMTWVIAGGSALVNTAAAGTLATIGSLKFNNTTETAATDFGSVWVSQFKYWPTVLPESQMQALTT